MWNLDPNICQHCEVLLGHTPPPPKLTCIPVVVWIRTSHLEFGSDCLKYVDFRVKRMSMA